MPMRFHGLVYTSVSMQLLIVQLKLLAATDDVVLIFGETGTGKELLAGALHHESKRRAQSFIPFNCSVLSRELIESRLFGHRKGAFTGAHRDHPGVIRAAAGGTVFFDEIGDLTLETQGALLRFLQSGELQPVGATTPDKANVRVVAATNRDLKAEVDAGRFRRDLYYRLNGFTLFSPALRSRTGDVKELALHFSRIYTKQYAMPAPAFSAREMRRLCEYAWPGNVRELENYIKRRVVFGDVEIEADGNLEAHGCSANMATQKRYGGETRWRDLRESEKQALLKDALEGNRGNVTFAARQLGISRRTIQRLRSKSE